MGHEFRERRVNGRGIKALKFRRAAFARGFLLPSDSGAARAGEKRATG